MNVELFRSICTSKKGATEEFPIDKNILVYKVMGKTFASTDIDYFSSITLKFTPETALDLIKKLTAVMPAYHVNKQHWISVSINDSISDQQLSTWIDDSYTLVVNGLAKSKKLVLKSL